MTKQEKSAATKRKAKNVRVWAEVSAYRARRAGSCSCRIAPNMTVSDLRPLGTGCATGWVCPVLDKYRRLAPNDTEEDYDYS
jgi:hypothetical protein